MAVALPKEIFMKFYDIFSNSLGGTELGNLSLKFVPIREKNETNFSGNSLNHNAIFHYQKLGNSW